MKLINSLKNPERNRLHIVAAAVILNLMIFCGAALSVSAQCGASFTSLASLPVVTKSTTLPDVTNKSLSTPLSEEANDPSIVGLWHVTFLVSVPDVGDVPIQEAFQIWNTGGTEVHNPRIAEPENPGTTAEVCLGAWSRSARRTFNLTHRVWNYSGGVYQGTINLTESVTVGRKGRTQSGTFNLAFYDPDGNFMFEVSGKVAGERITPEQ